jgi:hypothetical protein
LGSALNVSLQLAIHFSASLLCLQLDWFVKAKRPTPELTGRAFNTETGQVDDERQANSRSGSMSC